MELPFVTLDVFTRSRFTGNPLAVITIPASSPKPTQQQKQQLAREFNLSETVFVHDVADPKANTSRDIDIFLPFAEIPFAGHPTIGAAISLLAQGVDTLVTKAGPIPITKTGDDTVQAAIPHNVQLHAKRLRDMPFGPGDLAAVTAIREAELTAPIFSIVKGMSFILIQLPSLDLLSQVQQSTTFFRAEDLLDDGWQQGFVGRYYFVRTGAGRDEKTGQEVVELHARMIEHSLEDPATGSAACCLSSYLSVVGDKQTEPTRTYQITQGVDMGKESHITVEVGVKDSKVDHVNLAGSAVQVMRGHVTV